MERPDIRRTWLAGFRTAACLASPLSTVVGGHPALARLIIAISMGATVLLCVLLGIQGVLRIRGALRPGLSMYGRAHGPSSFVQVVSDKPIRGAYAVAVNVPDVGLEAIRLCWDGTKDERIDLTPANAVSIPSVPVHWCSHIRILQLRRRSCGNCRSGCRMGASTPRRLGQSQQRTTVFVHCGNFGSVSMIGGIERPLRIGRFVFRRTERPAREAVQTFSQKLRPDSKNTCRPYRYTCKNPKRPGAETDDCGLAHGPGVLFTCALVLRITFAVHDAPRAHRQVSEGVSATYPTLPLSRAVAVAAAGRVT